MDPNPSRRRWVTPLVIGVAAVVVIAAGYLLLVQPLRSVRSASATATAEPDVTSRTPPAHGSPGGPAVPGGAAAPMLTSQSAAGGGGPSGASMPTGDLPGWHRVFADDFGGSTLNSDWFTYEGQPSGDAAGYFSPNQVTVGGGLLNIAGSRDPSRGNIYVTGGVSNRATAAQVYGKYEVRFRMDLGRGVAYALLLWPHTNVYPPEIDFAEDNGTNRRTNYASVHTSDGSPTLEHTVAGNFTQWHTAGMEWTPGHIVTTLDGKPWADFTVGIPSQAMDLALQSQGWFCGQGWEACPDASTPAVVNLQIDWVVVYSQQG
jgi:beta-glucanase (GH16 family)